LKKQCTEGTWSGNYSFIAASSRYNLRILTYQWERTKQAGGILNKTPIVTVPLKEMSKGNIKKTKINSIMKTVYVLNLKDLHFSSLEKIT
jgi:hypothetical protein